jgi:hypothetical protein
VLGIAGSPRRKGNSDRLLEAALEGAREAGASTRTLVASVGPMGLGWDVAVVTFSVRVNTDVPPSAIITNVASVSSRASGVDEPWEGVWFAHSNRVINTITQVLGEKSTQPTETGGEELAASGSTTPAAAATALGLGLMVAGLTLLALSRKRDHNLS